MSTTDYLDFLPLYPTETEAACLARRRDWANEGLTEDSDRWVDTREGSHWFVCSMPSVKAEARLYDLIGSEVPASALVLWSWGSYLDDIGEGFDVPRNPAAFAGGEVTFSGGPDGTLIPAGTEVSVAPADESDPAPSFQTLADATIAAGVATVAVRAVEAGGAGNVSANSITAIGVPIPTDPPTVVTNNFATTGGEDVEDDEDYRDRIMEAFEGRGAGNSADYRRWAKSIPGVAHVTVIPVWDGPGTVKVIVSDINGDALPSGTIDALQAFLDPIPGKAEGQAPIGPTVTIATATHLDVTITGTVELEAGLVLSDVLAHIQTAIESYLALVEPGGEVVLTQVQARIATVTGVHDSKLVKINGVAANLAVDDDPAQIPHLVTLTIVEGAVP